MSTSKTIQANSSKTLLKESKVRILYPKMQRERNLSLQHSRSILSYNQYSKLQNYYCKKSKKKVMNSQHLLLLSKKITIKKRILQFKKLRIERELSRSAKNNHWKQKLKRMRSIKLISKIESNS